MASLRERVANLFSDRLVEPQQAPAPAQVVQKTQSERAALLEAQSYGYRGAIDNIQESLYERRNDLRAKTAAILSVADPTERTQIVSAYKAVMEEHDFVLKEIYDEDIQMHLSPDAQAHIIVGNEVAFLKTDAMVIQRDKLKLRADLAFEMGQKQEAYPESIVHRTHNFGVEAPDPRSLEAVRAESLKLGMSAAVTHVAEFLEEQRTGMGHGMRDQWAHALAYDQENRGPEINVSYLARLHEHSDIVRALRDFSEENDLAGEIIPQEVNVQRQLALVLVEANRLSRTPDAQEYAIEYAHEQLAAKAEAAEDYQLERAESSIHEATSTGAATKQPAHITERGITQDEAQAQRNSGAHEALEGFNPAGIYLIQGQNRRQQKQLDQGYGMGM